jgi:hypothetical protein
VIGLEPHREASAGDGAFHGRARPLRGLLACALVVTAGVARASAQTGTRGAAIDATAESKAKSVDGDESPWLLVPIFSSSPKLGVSAGALAGYLHYFDEKSQVSTFGINGQYTSTGSIVATAFGKASFDEDRQRALALLAAGNIKNDYSNYLGSGVPLQTEDELRAFVARYLHRVEGDWFAGVQGIYTNYYLAGQNAFDDVVLDTLGLKGFTSGGAGFNLYHDSRDNENSPTRGWFMNANNVAYREWIAGSENFDVYRVDFRGFLAHGEGNVLAARQFNQFTVGAPPAAFAPVQLRGYTMGEFLGKNMSSLEAEERFRIAERWTTTFFAGIAALYGNGQTVTDPKNLYPGYGLGIQYVIKQKEGMVLNLEFAGGKDGNYGVYMKFGYGF